MTIGLNNKVPPMRTYFPLLSFPLAVLLMLPSGRRERSDATRAAQFAVPGRPWPLNQWLAQPHKVRVAIVLLLVGVCMGIYRQGRRSVRVHRERQALEAFVAEARSDRTSSMSCWEAALPFELISPLDSMNGWTGISLVNLTWTQRTPWQDAIKRRFGIDNLARAICERDDIVLVATPLHRDLFERFARKHYHAELQFVESPRPARSLCRADSSAAAPAPRPAHAATKRCAEALRPCRPATGMARRWGAW